MLMQRARDHNKYAVRTSLLPVGRPFKDRPCGTRTIRRRVESRSLQRRYDVLSRCAFSKAVGEESRRDFLRRLLPCEARLAAKQTDIGQLEDLQYHYRLKLRNEVGIKARPMRLRPEEEAWLDVHLDKLVSKGVIGPILPDE